MTIHVIDQKNSRSGLEMTRSRNPNQTKNKTAGGGESMAGRGMEVVFSEPMAVVVICGIKREKERPNGGEEIKGGKKIK
jgi:hypothetical protein